MRLNLILNLAVFIPHCTGSLPRMNNKIKTVFFVSALLAFTSCKNEMYDILSRSSDDPDIFESPSVRSYITQNKIYTGWSSDQSTDLYILMRATDNENPFFNEIYRGTELAY